MDLLDGIKGLAQNAGAALEEKKGAYTLRILVAERKAFLSKKQITPIGL